MENPTKIITITWPLSPKRIVTKDDLFEALGIDATQYLINKLTANKWDTIMKDKDWSHINENIQVKVELIPRISKELITLKELLEEYVPPVIERYVALHHEHIWNKEHLWSVMLYDAHIDKLDVNWTTITSKVAKVKESTKRLLDKMGKFDLEKLLFVNGGDYFNTLTKWHTKWDTRQENNCSEKEAWKYWLELQIEMLELLWQLAPVESIFIEWNHEAEKLTYLRDAVAMYFKHCDHINILEWNGDRQYYQYWNTTMGRTHWDKIKPQQLVNVAQQENSNKTYEMLEMFQWHLHKSSKETYAWAIVEVLTWASWQNDRARGRGYDIMWRGQINWYVHHKEEWRIAHIIQNV